MYENTRLYAISRRIHMTLATDPKHAPSCTGCPACSAELASTIAMAATQYSAWLSASTAEHHRHHALRANEFGVPAPVGLVDRIRAAAGRASEPVSPSGVGVPTPVDFAARIRASKARIGQ
jgi:hypothetical protein